MCERDRVLAYGLAGIDVPELRDSPYIAELDRLRYGTTRRSSSVLDSLVRDEHGEVIMDKTIAQWRYGAYVIMEGKKYLKCRINGETQHIPCDPQTTIIRSAFYLILADSDWDGGVVNLDKEELPEGFPYKLELLDAE